MNRFRIAPAALALALLATGCGDDKAAGGAQPTGAVEKGGVAVIAELADINAPMTIIGVSSLDLNLAGDVMNMALLHGAWRDGRMVFLNAAESPMALARSYEYVGADSAALRFHMRSDVKWSDGQPLTAPDIVFTYKLVREPALASPRIDYVEHLDSVTAQNDSTVTMYFERRYPQMLSHSSLNPVPEHVFGKVAPDKLRTHPSLLNPGSGKLVVSGPFMIGEWRQGERVVLVPNPYFLPKPNLDQIVIRIIPEPVTRMVELQTGNVDFVPAVSFDQLANLRAQPSLRMEKEEKRFYDYVAYNPSKVPAFADPEIRRALGMAINVPQMIQAMQMSEFAVPAGGPYPPIFRDMYDPKLTPPVPFDLEGAKRILDAKGWRDTDGDGIRDKDGKPFRFSFITNAGNQRRMDAAQIVQAAWRQLGVDAQFRTVEFNSMTQSLMKHEYEAVLGGWGVGLGGDLTPLFGKDSPQNIILYKNPEAWALFEKALSAPTQEAAAPYWKQAAALIARDQPYTWLYYLDQVDGVQDRLKNTKVDTYSPYNNLWEWWIPASQRRAGVASAAPPAAKDSATR
jgi:peptide/nickel transport system substrate-binding protein